MPTSERRPVDCAQMATGILDEAAELAEHIRDKDPRNYRKEMMDLLIEMIDDGAQEAFDAYTMLDGDE